MKIKCLLLTALILAFTSIDFAQSKTESSSGIRAVDFKSSVMAQIAPKQFSWVKMNLS